MVPVPPGDLEIGLGIAELAEAVLAQNRLRTKVLRNGAGLNSVQAEFAERDGYGFPHRRGGEPLPAQVFREPVAHDRGLERASRDGQSDPSAGNSRIVGDDEAVQFSGGLFRQALRHEIGLRGCSEIGVWAHRFPGRHELSIACQGIGEGIGIGLLQKTSMCIHKGNCLRPGAGRPPEAFRLPAVVVARPYSIRERFGQS